MRTYAYVRNDPGSECDDINYISYFYKNGYQIPKQRLIFEEVTVDTSIIYRDKFINLINYGLEADDLLLVKGVDCLGRNFEEIYNIVNRIDQKKIRLVCFDYSKNEISGDLKVFFLHFLKICFEFEGKFKKIHKNYPTNNFVKKVGRPEILSPEQKKEVINKFKKGHSVYSLAKEYSVTRTVINRLLEKASQEFN